MVKSRSRSRSASKSRSKARSKARSKSRTESVSKTASGTFKSYCFGCKKQTTSKAVRSIVKQLRNKIKMKYVCGMCTKCNTRTCKIVGKV